MNDAVRNRLRFKIFTSFAIFALGLIMIARLWSVAPPSAATAPAYGTALLLALAALWRGVIFARAIGSGAKS
jgi:hypothetical protein